MLVQRLLRHTDLVGADPAVVAGLLLRSVSRGDVGSLPCSLLHCSLIDALLGIFESGALKTGGVIRHDLPLDLIGGLILEGHLPSVVACGELVLLRSVRRLDLRLAHHRVLGAADVCRFLAHC